MALQRISNRPGVVGGTEMTLFSRGLSPEMRDALTISELVASGRIQLSDLDADRRAAVMRRSPQSFSHLSPQEAINFFTVGIPFEQGYLQQWVAEHPDVTPAFRNPPSIGKGGIFLLDHLPRRSVAFAPIIVPYLGGEYSGKRGQFLDYPKSQGYDLDQLQNGDLGDQSLDEGLKFLQSWLFFGLIRETLGKDARVNPDYWTRWDAVEQRLVMTSPYLPRILDNFAQSLKKPSRRPPFHVWDAILRMTLAVAEKFTTKLDENYKAGTRTDEPDSLKVLWSIFTLGQMFSNIVLQSYGIEKTSYIEQWPDSPLVERRLEGRGLCSREILRLTTILSADTLYFVSLMPWYLPGNPYAPDAESTLLPEIENLALRFKNQVIDQNQATEPESRDNSLSIMAREHLRFGQRSHRTCSLERCTACLIDHDKYTTMHVLPDCECPFFGPRMSDVYRLLTNGKIPVLQWKKLVESKGQIVMAFNVIDSELVPEYVAVSHVWSDGLGNAKQNQLPRCQLFHLTNLIRELTGGENTPFWIDTLCVPRDEKQRPKALKLMNKTYRCSARTLVLDANLQHFKSHRGLITAIKDTDVLLREQIKIGIVVELILRIACSSWCTRLWTLPEAQVPPFLHFQFSDGVVELGDLFGQLNNWPFVGSSIVHDLQTFLSRLRPQLLLQPGRGSPTEDPQSQRWPDDTLTGRFISLLHCIEWRDSSRTTDEWLCLATQLDLDIASLYEYPPEYRQGGLLMDVNTLPADLIFTHGPRLPDKLFRWAPKSLLTFQQHFSFVPAAKPDIVMGRMTKSGLLFSGYPSYLIQEGPTTDSPYLLFVVPDNDSPDEFEGVHVSLYSMSTVESSTSLGKPWNTTELDSICRDEPFCVIVGPDKMPGPGATEEGGRMGLIIKKDVALPWVIIGTPLQTVVIYRIPGYKVTRDDLDLRRANELPSTMQFCLG